MNIIIHKSTITPFPLNRMNKVDKIITCNWRIDPEDFGLATEVVEKAYDNYNDLRVAYVRQTESKFKVLFVISNDDVNTVWGYLLQMISLFNQAPSKTETYT
jgi:hypothetical protein